MQKKIKIQILVLAIFAIFGLGLASAENPIIDFVESDTGISLQQDQAPDNQNSQAARRQNGGLLSRFVGWFGSLFGASNAPDQEVTPATVVCSPTTIVANEPFLVAWKCNPNEVGAQPEVKAHMYYASAMAPQTVALPSQAAGTKVLQPLDGARLTSVKIVCSGKARPQARANSVQEGECGMTTITPSIVLEAVQNPVESGRTTRIRWTGTDIRTCVLTSDADPDWQKVGVRGDVETHSIDKETVFTLTCKTQIGRNIHKSITVTTQ